MHNFLQPLVLLHELNPLVLLHMLPPRYLLQVLVPLVLNDVLSHLLFFLGVTSAVTVTAGSPSRQTRQMILIWRAAVAEHRL